MQIDQFLSLSKWNKMNKNDHRIDFTPPIPTTISRETPFLMKPLMEAWAVIANASTRIPYFYSPRRSRRLTSLQPLIGREAENNGNFP